MHSIKITPNLIFEHQCTSGKFIRLLNRIESKLFFPELECSAVEMTPIALVHVGGGTRRVVVPRSAQYSDDDWPQRVSCSQTADRRVTD